MSQYDRARRGLPPCVQPLIVTPGAGVKYDPARHKVLFVVAGHLRQAGNERLGKKAPPLNCIVREYRTEADMLADMSAENGIRRDLSPLEWGVHYQAQIGLLLEQGLDEPHARRQVCRDAGVTLHVLNARLDLLRLPHGVQQRVHRGELAMTTALELLHAAPDRAALARLATQAAKTGATLEEVRTAGKLARRARPKVAGGVGDLPENNPATLDDLRAASAVHCAACHVQRLAGGPEPAWHLARAAAGEVCAACDLKKLKDACAVCPLPQMLRMVVQRHAKTAKTV